MTTRSTMTKAPTLLHGLPGYPFFPCRICQWEGFGGKANGSCDHTVFERARAMYPTLVSGRRALSEKDA